MRYWPWPGGWGHGTTVCVVLNVAEREQLAAIVADCNRPRKHGERARIVLASADRHSAQQVAQRIGSVGRRCGGRGFIARKDPQARQGADRGGSHGAGGGADPRLRGGRLCTAPPHQATHWTGRAMANAVGMSLGSVQRIRRAHKLQPHRLRTFKRSRDPGFAAKLTDIVSLGACPRAGPSAGPGGRSAGPRGGAVD